MSTPRDDTLSPDDPADAVSGIGESRVESLGIEGYETVEDLQLADVGELASVIPSHVASDVKGEVGDKVENVPTVAEAKAEAREIPGAKAKVVKGPDGRQRGKVLKKEREESLGGATMEIHKG